MRLTWNLCKTIVHTTIYIHTKPTTKRSSRQAFICHRLLNAHKHMLVQVFERSRHFVGLKSLLWHGKNKYTCHMHTSFVHVWIYSAIGWYFRMSSDCNPRTYIFLSSVWLRGMACQKILCSQRRVENIIKVINIARNYVAVCHQRKTHYHITRQGKVWSMREALPSRCVNCNPSPLSRDAQNVFVFFVSVCKCKWANNRQIDERLSRSL